jgi:hypothetical protein
MYLPPSPLGPARPGSSLTLLYRTCLWQRADIGGLGQSLQYIGRARYIANPADRVKSYHHHQLLSWQGQFRGGRWRGDRRLTRHGNIVPCLSVQGRTDTRVPWICAPTPYDREQRVSREGQQEPDGTHFQGSAAAAGTCVGPRERFSYVVGTCDYAHVCGG